MKNKSYKTSSLRKQAESFISDQPQIEEPFSPDDMRKVIQELRIHQIELEMQNEELRKIQLELEESRFKYVDLYDFCPIGYFVLDKDGLIIETNLTGAEMTGIERNTLLHTHFQKCITRSDKDAFYLYYRQVLKAKKRLTCELNMVKKGGDLFFARLDSIAVKDSEGAFTQCRLAVTDISESKRAEEILLQAAKLESLGVLAGGIAHDFNNLLTVILGNISLARMDLAPDNEISTILEVTQREVYRASGLTQQLLTFSRGGLPVKKNASISELITDNARFALSGSKSCCRFILASDLWNAEIDEGQISQVIQNIIINADQAMPEGGIITIHAENLPADPDNIQPVRKKNCVKISIEDEGVGILPEHLTIIFDPYFTTKRKGSGLGLAICFSIIRSHNGFIEVKSELGKGSVFTLYLPAAEKDTVKMAKPEKTIRAGKGKILLMDDEESILQSTGMLLRKLGYTVETTHNGHEAVERYREALQKRNPFDLCIMDLTVPGSMGGSEARERIAALDPGVRAIVSSGYSDDPIMSEHTKYGFIGVLVKPYHLDELARLLHEILDS